MSVSVLVVENDSATAVLLDEELESKTLVARTPEGALRLAEEEEPGLVLVDLSTPGASDPTFFRRLNRITGRSPVIVIADGDTVGQGLEFLEKAAFDFIVKPVEDARLLATVSNALAHGAMRRRLRLIGQGRREREGLQRLIGKSEALVRGKKVVREIARSEAPILIQGAAGTGKRAFARAIHAESERAAGPFERVDCAGLKLALAGLAPFREEQETQHAILEVLLEKLEAAREGTVFLDDVDQLPLSLQEHLLAVLREGRSFRVSRDLDLRFVAATKGDLRGAVTEGVVLKDLNAALSPFTIELPPLCDRAEDIPALAESFLALHSERMRLNVHGFQPEVLSAFQAHDWPGNVRELENTVQRAVLFERTDSISPSSLPFELRRLTVPPETPNSPRGCILAFAEEEKRILYRALSATEWNVAKAAAELGIGRATLYRKIQKYDLKAEVG